MITNNISQTEREEQERVKETETQRRIAAANITHGDSQDIPGARIARWTDHNGDARTTLYFAKQDAFFEYYLVQVADYQDGSFGASNCLSDTNAEDAVNRWIAAWW